MGSFTNNQAFDLPDFNSLNCGFLNPDLTEMCTSQPDHSAQASRFQNRALDSNFADNKSESWDDFGHLTFSLDQEELLGLDDFGLDGSGDNAGLDPWYEALTMNFDMPPRSQSDVPPLDAISDSRTAEFSMPLENVLANVPSSVAVAITSGNIYQPTPDLTECSTPASLSFSSGFRDPNTGGSSNFDTEDQRWHATLSRSRTADRYFLYGVLTTKIYCRPSCASRRPSRRHVRFFSFPGAIEAAEQTKLRPCKRCKPETQGPGNTGVLAVAQTLRKIIAETFEKRNDGKRGDLKLESLAKSAGLSIFHFHRLFKATTRITPADFITACRALSLQDDLCTYSTRGDGLDPCAVHLSPSWSERTARKALGGLNPVDYASGARSLSIEYCCVCSPVGGLEVAYSRAKNTSNVVVHAVVLSQDGSLPIDDHFKISRRSEDYTQRLQQCVRELEEECQDRDIQLATDVLSVLWRARLWLKLSQDNGLK